MDLWITGTTPEVFAARQLHVYMLIWDRNDPRSINRVTLSQGKLMTYRDGSNVPYYFVKDLDVSKYGGKDFGMMLYFVDDSDGRAIWKTSMPMPRWTAWARWRGGSPMPAGKKHRRFWTGSSKTGRPSPWSTAAG